MNKLENEFANLDFEEDVYDELPDFCYVQLQGWMVKIAHKYDLALNELMIYAVIHSFSQDGVSVFRGSRDYLRLWAFCGRTSAFEKVKKLMDLKLIGREYVKYKGKEFPTFFTYASRNSLKHTVTSFRKSSKGAVQNLNPNGEIDTSEFKNCTEQVQNLNSNSSEFGPNNNLNKNLKEAAEVDSSRAANSSEESAAAAFVSSKVKEVLGCNPYPGKFILEMSERFETEGFDEGRVVDYLKAVTEKVKAKNPDSIHALFRKIVLADDVIADFVLKHPAKEKPKTVVCPVCGCENHQGILTCTHCEFDFSYRSDRREIERSKRIYALSPAEKQTREEEIKMVLKQFPVTDFWNIENIQKRNMCIEDIDRKYKVIA